MDENTTTATGSITYINTAKPKTRIEKLGELYDAACERIALRQSGLNNRQFDLEDHEHSWDMQVITTYLDQTKRPEREQPMSRSAILTAKIDQLTDEKYWAIRDIVNNELAKL
tara:strand:+ start:119 stop:457 length:339 start_codon:yes stop_codon:yes gene_type:complete